MHNSSDKWWYHSSIIIVNFVKGVSANFSVYKNPYFCCQMSFSLSEYTKVDVAWCFALDPTGRAYSAPLDSLWLVKKGHFTRGEDGMELGKG